MPCEGIQRDYVTRIESNITIEIYRGINYKACVVEEHSKSRAESDGAQLSQTTKGHQWILPMKLQDFPQFSILKFAKIPCHLHYPSIFVFSPLQEKLQIVLKDYKL